jgi:hypothetical protein
MVIVVSSVDEGVVGGAVVAQPGEPAEPVGVERSGCVFHVHVHEGPAERVEHVELVVGEAAGAGLAE